MQIKTTSGDADPYLRRQIARRGDTLGRALTPPRCALYLRVSSPEQDWAKGAGGRRVRPTAAEREREVKRSLDTQEAEGRAYADRLGYAVVEVYRETFSSLEFWERPVFQRLRRDVVAGAFEVIVALKLERLGATSTQLYVFEDLLARHGARLEFVQHTFEDNPLGRISKTVMSEFNGLRIEGLREQFSRAKGARIEANRPLHGRQPPYGCAWTDEARIAYRYVEPEATYMRELYEWYDPAGAGWSLRRIARHMMARGIPAPYGGRAWHATTVGNLLRNPRYCGRPMARRYETVFLPGATPKGYRRRHNHLRAEDAERPPVALAENQPGLVPAEQWERVNARLEANKGAQGDRESRGGRPPSPAAGWLLLGGYAICATCKRPLTSAKASSGLRYACRANKDVPGSCSGPVAVSKTLLEAHVWARVVATTIEPEVIAGSLAAYRDAAFGEGREAHEATRRALEATLADARAQQASLASDLGRLRTEGARAAVLARMDELAEDEAKLAAELARHEAEAASLATAEAGVRDFVASAHALGARLAPVIAAGDLPFATKRLAVEVLSPVVTVAPASCSGKARTAHDLPVAFPPEARRYEALTRALGDDPAGDAQDASPEEPHPGDREESVTDQTWYITVSTGLHRLRPAPLAALIREPISFRVPFVPRPAAGPAAGPARGR